MWLSLILHDPLHLVRDYYLLEHNWKHDYHLLIYTLSDGDQGQGQIEANQQRQEEDDQEVDVQDVIHPPQRLTRSMFKALGNNGQLFSLFVISLVDGA